MPKVPYDVIAASKPFRFLVGPDKKEFFMHADLFARMSEPLRTLVNGEWKESKEGLVDWSEIDEGTFIRFCEYAYTGGYRAAVPFSEESPAPAEMEGGKIPGEAPVESQSEEPLEIEEEPDEPEPESNYDMWHSGGRRIEEQKLVMRKRDIMLAKFNLVPGKEPNTNPLTNYSEVFLSHARLYAFADCYAIDELAKLCILELRYALQDFDLHGGTRVADVAQLIDFSYQNTRSGSVKQDKLRALLSTYIACHIEELWPNFYFRDIIESGEIARDIIEKLLERLD